jgi:hypothetical protein
VFGLSLFVGSAIEDQLSGRRDFADAVGIDAPSAGVPTCSTSTKPTAASFARWCDTVDCPDVELIGEFAEGEWFGGGGHEVRDLHPCRVAQRVKAPRPLLGLGPIAGGPEYWRSWSQRLDAGAEGGESGLVDAVAAAGGRRSRLG